VNTAAAAAAVADHTVAGIAGTERYLAGRYPWAEQMFTLAWEAALGDGTAHTRVTAAQPADPRLANQIVFAAQDAATRRIWQGNRIVHTFDPDLWEQLGEVDEDMILPGSVFEHLPYPDPFLVWPEPIVHTLHDGNQAVTVGCFITGRSVPVVPHPDVWSGPDTKLGWPISTHSPHGSGSLVVTIISEVHDRPGHQRRLPRMDNLPDTLISRVTFDLSKDVRVGDLIDRIGRRYREDVERGAFERSVRPMLRRIIAALLYLCATNADLRPLPAPAARRAAKGAQRAAKPPKVVNVGFVVGAGLRAWRRTEREAKAERPSGTGGRHVRPHVRRAHPHLYWTGEGRKTPRVRWVWPVRVNAHLYTMITTVQPLRRRKEPTS
jgi:hypothetical protein